MARTKKQTIQYVLVGLLVLGLAYLLLRRVEEGFTTSVEKYTKSAPGADVRLMKSEIPEGVTKLTDILVTGYNKTTKKYDVQSIKSRLATGVDTSVRFEIWRPNHPSQKIVKFYNASSNRTPKLPIDLSTYALNPSDFIFVENLSFKNLQFSDNPSITLGTQFDTPITGRTLDSVVDSNGNNIKVTFVFA